MNIFHAIEIQIFNFKKCISSCKLTAFLLTHWGRVTHICVRKLTIIGSDNGFSPGRRQAIIWTNAGILLIRTSGTNFSEILDEIHSFSFSKMRLKMSSAKWRLFGLGLNELNSSCYHICPSVSIKNPTDISYTHHHSIPIPKVYEYHDTIIPTHLPRHPSSVIQYPSPEL